MTTTTMTTTAATNMLDASRVMPVRRASTRLSTYSVTPTLAPSIAPSRLSMAQSDPKCSLDLSEFEAYYRVELNNRASYAPAPRTASVGPVQEESVASVQTHLERMEDKRLQSQRYNVSEGKQEELSRLALGAKLERALGRRMTGQDAVFTAPKRKKYVMIGEKPT